MTDWHIGWQKLVPSGQREIRVTRGGVWHRADIRATDGQIVEVQHSPIKLPKIREREEFYGDMVWLWDLTEADLSFDPQDPEAPPGYFRFEWSTGVRFAIVRSERQAFFDLGKNRIFQVGAMSYDGKAVSGWGKAIDKAQMVQWINSGPPSRLTDPMPEIKRRRAEVERKKAAEAVERLRVETELARIQAAKEGAQRLAEWEAGAEQRRKDAEEAIERRAKQAQEAADREARREAEQKADLLHRDEELRRIGSSLDEVLGFRDLMPVLSRLCSDREMVGWGRAWKRADAA
jgi:hypothetical protein